MDRNNWVSELAEFIKQVGFPIFVSLYLLFRLEPSIEELAETISKLTIIVAQINGIDISVD